MTELSEDAVDRVRDARLSGNVIIIPDVDNEVVYASHVNPALGTVAVFSISAAEGIDPATAVWTPEILYTTDGRGVPAPEGLETPQGISDELDFGLSQYIQLGSLISQRNKNGDVLSALFDGVDFATLSDEEIEAKLTEALEALDGNE